jgi:cell division protease FtsH
MLDDLVMFLGGRVAEEIACGDVTTGASNDLERATKLARQMVTRFGMTEALGTQVYGDADHNPFLGRDYSTTPEYSPETAARIDAEVSRLMTEARDRAEKILTERRAQLDLIVEVLIERETIDIEAVTALLDNKWDEYLAKEAQRNKEQAERVEAIKDRGDSEKLAASTPSAGVEAASGATPAVGHEQITDNTGDTEEL